MRIKLQAKVTIGFLGVCLIGIIAMICEAARIAKLAGIEDSAGMTSTIVSVVMAAVLMLVVTGASVFVVRRTLRRHVENLTVYSDMISKGEVGMRVEAPIKDEFEEIYHALNAMVESNRKLAEIAEKISEGDLTVEVKQRGDKDLLGKSLASLIKNNNEVLAGIKESSFQLTTGAEQVAAASQALAQGSTEQASAVEQVTTSMKNIEVMTKDNAKQAVSASEIVYDTRNAANLGNERMSQMKNAMDDINASSEKISKIIKVIDDISFQTNILALNAAVEAARAGEHGKGFAVVAEQIRELAGKSASAAAETADMIDDSIRKVQKGTGLASETEKALCEIVEDISEVVEITEAITRASNAQAEAIEQIDQAMEQVSQVVQNNSATSEECAAASEELSSQSQSLRQRISKYKLSVSEDTEQGTYKPDSYVPVSIKLDDDEEINPEKIISLDGGFGKY